MIGWSHSIIFSFILLLVIIHSRERREREKENVNNYMERGLRHGQLSGGIYSDLNSFFSHAEVEAIPSMSVVNSILHRLMLKKPKPRRLTPWKYQQAACNFKA